MSARSTVVRNGFMPTMLRPAVDVTIIDYGMGNIGSIENMVEKVGGKTLVSR